MKKKRLLKAAVGWMLSASIIAGSFTGVLAAEPESTEVYDAVLFDSTEDVAQAKPYLALGENLKESEKKEVLKLLNIDESKLDEYSVVTVTNEQEHHYLDSYVDKSKIGTRALSSVVIREAQEGSGLHFSIYNIDYCTVGMYQNVCTTVGIKDADITIAGPFKLSGTAALIGIIKAYEEMTGTTVDEKVADAAMEELVTTGDIIENFDGKSEDIEALIAELKSKIQDINNDADIDKLINDTIKEHGIKLTDDEKAKIKALLLKLKNLDLNWDFIEQQANDLLELWNNSDASNIWDNIVAFFKNLIAQIKNLFK